MVAYLKAGPQVRIYSDYLRATREAEKEDSIELSRSSRSQLTNGPSKPRTTSFFPLRKLNGKQPAVWLVHLDEEDADDGEDPESNDPDGIEGVTEDFMVWLARAVKDAQMDEKCCYHCSSPEHFICNCLLMKAARDKEKRRLRKHETTFADSLLESRPFSMLVWDRECSQSKDKWGKLHGPLK